MELTGLADLTHTRRVSLYRLRPGEDLYSMRAPRVIQGDHEFITLRVTVGGLPALLVAGLPEDSS
ncbi:hypothetical protein KIPE111705_07305 [Kibdelosporangium persicum]|uniref:Uncharacterized protein n=1 Tax=Kibdelosporangium persicum TaxID=2698649 RepID=A0ABX2F1N8_9PSEU|nr:hypothetical protein [Kibdelosporangium persicum]NRN65231.1 hypothetical protein [Kibdelosporangium persicum]